MNNQTRRLSLDLPKDTHEQLDEIGSTLGHTSKSETARNAILYFHGLMEAVLDGHRIMVRDPSTGTMTPFYGSPHEHLYQRIKRLKKQQPDNPTSTAQQ